MAVESFYSGNTFTTTIVVIKVSEKAHTIKLKNATEAMQGSTIYKTMTEKKIVMW